MPGPRAGLVGSKRYGYAQTCAGRVSGLDYWLLLRQKLDARCVNNLH